MRIETRCASFELSTFCYLVFLSALTVNYLQPFFPSNFFSGLTFLQHCVHQLTVTTNPTDDKILLQLSKPPVRPGQTPEDDQRFRDGLRAVLSELRTKGLTQLDDIAKRMTQYRREFLSNYSLGYDQHVYVPTDAA